jgi:MFS family permease
MVGPVVGPPLGGFITTYFDWRWIFFINIPIGLLGIALSTLYFENIREPDRPPLDFTGFLLSGVGLAALMLGLATGGRHLLPIEASVACACCASRPSGRVCWVARCSGSASARSRSCCRSCCSSASD